MLTELGISGAIGSVLDSVSRVTLEVSFRFPFLTLSQYLLQSRICISLRLEDLDYGSGYTDHRR